MKLIKHVLSQDVLSLCLSELNLLLKKTVWSSSQIAWEEGIKQNIIGSCLTTSIEGDLKIILTSKLKDILPPYKTIYFQFHVWQKNSGISFHDDRNYTWGATLYLNNKWHINDGGLFIWQEKSNKELHAICPEFNSLVINDCQEGHLVTPVGVNVIENRYTIQIWGNN